MTRPDPRPGAHNHIEGAPKPSLDYVREMGDDEGWEPVFEDGEPTEAFRSSLRAYVDAELAQTFIVRFTYKRKGHPRAALDSVLKGIHPSVFETEVLDA